MKNPWVVVLVVAVFLIGGSVWYSSNVSAKNNEGIVFSPHIKGNLDAPVSLVEYSDFQCPACASFQPVVTEVLAEYGEAISLEYKNFPLPIHNFAELAARAAEAAAQQNAFFAYHDLLFTNQSTWSRSPNPKVFFIQYAEELGLDVATFKRHLNASLIRDKVKADGKEARNQGLSGTPTFFLNGERMSFETLEDFKQQIALAVNPGNQTTETGEVIESQNPANAVQFGI